MRTKQQLLLLVLMLFAGGLFAQHSVLMAPPKARDYKAKVEVTNVISEVSPNLKLTGSSNSDAAWDLLYSFNVGQAGEQAIATDGEFVYTMMWQTDGVTRKYDLQGNLVDEFTIAGVGAGIRDLAFDGTYFYGGINAATIFKMDFTNETLIGTITVPSPVRHCSYDPEADGGNGGLWIGEWGTLRLVSMSGAALSGPFTIADVYGSAYDGWSDGGPYLWLFSQGGNGADIQQWSIATQALTGVSHDASDLPGFVVGGSIAGGLDASADLVPGKFVILGNIQQDPNLGFVYEVTITTPADAPAAVTNFTVTPGASGALTADLAWTNPALTYSGATLTDLDQVVVYRDGGATAIYSNTTPVIGGAETFTDNTVTSGMHTYEVYGINDAGDGSKTSVTLYVGLDVPPAVEGFTVVAINDNADAYLTWTNPTGSVGLNGGFWDGSISGYSIVRDGATTLTVTGTATEYTDLAPSTGNHTYEITIENAIGDGGSASGSVLIGNFLLYDDFADLNNWTAGGLTGNWVISQTANAGGAAPEAMFNWSPSITGDSYIISPIINTTGIDVFALDFKHFVNDFSGSGYTLNVKTTSDGGTTWHDAWSIAPTGDVGPETVSLNIGNADVGSATFQVAFVFSGVSFDIDYWFVDEVRGYEGVPFHDAGVFSIDMVPMVTVGTYAPLATVKNYGTYTENISVTMTIGSYTSTKTATGVEPGATAQVTFDDWAAAIGTYTISVTTTIADDNNPDNDNMTQAIEVVSAEFIYDEDAYAMVAGDVADFGWVNLANGALTSTGPSSVTDPFPMAADFAGPEGEEVLVYINLNGELFLKNGNGTEMLVGTITGMGANTPTGITFDNVNEKCYVVAAEGTGAYSVLYEVDTETFVATQIGNDISGYMLIAGDLAADGYIYGPCIVNDVLIQIDPATGDYNDMGALGIDINYGQDIDYDAVSNQLYTYACTAAGGSLFGTYDMESGAFTQIADAGASQYPYFAIIPGEFVPPTDLALTFTVNMNIAIEFELFDPATDTVYVAGDFPQSDWQAPGSNPELELTDEDGDGYYSVTVLVEAGTYEYKYFLNSGWTGGEWEGGDNRVVVVADDMETDDLWANFTSVPSIESANIQMYPNPVNSVLTLTNVENANIYVIDILGKVVNTISNANSIEKLDVTGFAAGTYIVRIEKAGTVVTSRFNVVR